MRATANITALVGGLVVIALGVALLLAAGGEITLRFAEAGPLIVAGVGAVLLASGLEARARGRN